LHIEISSAIFNLKGVSQLVDLVAEEPEFVVTDTDEFYYLHLADLAL